MPFVVLPGREEVPATPPRYMVITQRPEPGDPGRHGPPSSPCRTRQLPLRAGMVGSSSRGPRSTNLIKPEIGAPGASVSAVAGTGNGTEAFGGTSGATPDGAGSAALLIDAYPDRTGRDQVPADEHGRDQDLQQHGQHTPVSLRSPDHPYRRRRGPRRSVTRARRPGRGAPRPRPAPCRSASWMRGGLRPPSHAWSRSAMTGGSSLTPYAIKPKFRYSDDRLSGAIRFTAPGHDHHPGSGARRKLPRSR